MQTHSQINPIRLDLAARGLIDPENKGLSTATSKRHGKSGALVFDLARDCFYDHKDQTGGGYVDLAKRFGLQHNERARPTIIKEAPKPSENERIAKAWQIWNAGDAWQHSPVERYLDGRGVITLHLWDLGYHPALSMRIDGKLAKTPAMLAQITDALTGDFLGIHRTALNIEGCRVRKRKDANGKSIKMMLGKAKGGVVKLDGNDLNERKLAVAEGIESACSAIQIGFKRTWAALSSGGMAGLPLVPETERLDIFSDNDEPGQRAAETLAERYAAAGVPVSIHLTTQARTDINDLMGAV